MISISVMVSALNIREVSKVIVSLSIVSEITIKWKNYTKQKNIPLLVKGSLIDITISSIRNYIDKPWKEYEETINRLKRKIHKSQYNNKKIKRQNKEINTKTASYKKSIEMIIERLEKEKR